MPQRNSSRRRQQGSNSSGGTNAEFYRQQMADQFRQQLLSEFNQAWNHIGQQQFRSSSNNNNTTQDAQNRTNNVQANQQLLQDYIEYAHRQLLPHELTDTLTPRYPHPGVPNNQPTQSANRWSLDQIIQQQQQQPQQQQQTDGSPQFAYNQFVRRGDSNVPTVGASQNHSNYPHHSLQYRRANSTLVRGQFYNNNRAVDPCPNLSEEDVYQLMGVDRQQVGTTTEGGLEDIEGEDDDDEEEDMQQGVDGGLVTERGWWQQQAGEANQIVETGTFPKIPVCSFLTQGMAFSGQQMVRNAQLSPSQDEQERQQNRWGVTVIIQGVDMEGGRVCGMMQASNVPGAASPILTFWTGEIIDNINHTLLTNNWGARPMDDKHFWSHFSSYADIQENCVNGRSHLLPSHSHIYMRWKEQFFINDCPNSRLTISGFYYIALNRQTGEIQGWYFDKNMGNSYQELLLHRVSGNKESKEQLAGRKVLRIVTNQQQRCKNVKGQSFPSYKLY